MLLKTLMEIDVCPYMLVKNVRQNIATRSIIVSWQNFGRE